MMGERIHQLEGGGVMFWCPACDCAHGGPRWHEVSPGSIQPSVAIVSSGCHVTVTNYEAEYAVDCTNGWAGRRVMLEPW